MRHRCPQILAGALLLLTATAAVAGDNRWTSQGPYGGEVAAVAVDPSQPSIVYAGTRGNGIFKSTDHGVSWAPIDAGLPPGRFVNTLIIDPTNPATVYASLGTDGVFKTTDRGRRWRRMYEGFPVPNGSVRAASVVALTLDPASPMTLFAGFVFDGLFRSTDGGALWTPVDTLPEREVRGVTIDPTSSSTVYAATGGGVYKSTDGGSSWARLAGGLEDRAYNGIIASEIPGTVYAWSLVQPGGQLYRSRDSGTTWTQLSFPGSSFLRTVVLDPSDDATVYAVTSSNSDIFKSTDGGDTWSAGSDGITSLAPVSLAVDPSDPQVLYAGTLFGGGLFKSTDAGANWSASNKGLINTEVSDVAIDPANPSTLYATSNRGVSKSTDGGASWTDIGPATLPTSIISLAVDPSAPANVYAGGGSSVTGAFGGGIFKTEDAGTNWDVAAGIFDVPGSIEDLEIDPLTPTTLYAVSGGSVFRSEDGGASWIEASQILANGSLTDLEIDPAAPATLYASTINFSLTARVYKSLDRGDTWFESGDGLPPNPLLSLAIDPQNPAALYAATFRGVFKTTDSGANWLPTGSLPAEAAIAVAVDPTNSSTIYASTFFGVSKSIDGGASWYPLDEGLTRPVVDIEVDPVDPRILHVGTQGGGVFDLVQDFDCTPGPHNLCLDDEPGDRRFEVSLIYDTDLGPGARGDADATPLNTVGVTRGGVLSFFDPANPEVLVKVLDGCGVNERFWVFYAATTTAGFRLRVTDTAAGISRVYTNNDQNTAATVTDIDAFPTCGSSRPDLVPSPSTPRQTEPSVLVGHEFPLSRGAGAGGRGGQGVRGSKGTTCSDDATTLCIDDQAGDGRFRISATYDTTLGPGAAGDANAVPLTSLGITRGGILWFFDDSNPEILVKVLDGCAVNGHYWVFYAATTNAGFTLTIEDTVAGGDWTFVNPDLQAASPVADILAFGTCETSP